MLTANQAQFSLTGKSLPIAMSVDAFALANQNLSENYVIKIWIHTSAPLSLSTLLNQEMQLTLLNSATPNFLHGIVSQAKSLGVTPVGKQFSYFLIIESPLFLLKNNMYDQVFLNQSVIDIVREVLQKYDGLKQLFAFQLRHTYPKRECMIQNNESDYDFITRLLRFWGLFFAWQQSSDNFKLIITDNLQHCDTLFSSVSLSYAPLSGAVRPQTSVFFLQNKMSALAQNIMMRDYNSEQTELSILAQTKPKANIAIPSVGIEDRYGEHCISQQEADFIANVRQQALDWQRNLFIFYSDDPMVQPGQRIKLTDCIKANYNRDYRIIAVAHYGDQSAGKIYIQQKFEETEISDADTRQFQSSLDSKQSYETDWSQEDKDNSLTTLTYYNKLLCIPADVSYSTYLPVNFQAQHGLMLATIESPDDSPYAYLDNAGKYRLRFPFDNSDKPKGQASAAIRLAQPYSGEGFGTHFPLRAGTQVLLAFENGDINRPVLMGALPCSNQPSPVTSQNLTQNILRTPSDHTLMMDDTEGQNLVQLATKDQRQQLTLNAADHMHRIHLATQQGSMVLQTKKTFTTQTNSDFQQQIGNHHQVTIENQYHVATQEGDVKLAAGRDVKFKAQQNMIMQAQKNVAVQSGNHTVFKSGDGAIIKSDKGNITITTSQGSFSLQAKQGISMSTFGRGDITIAQKGAMVKITQDGQILAQGKQIHVYAQQQNLVGAQAHLGGHGKAAPSPTPQMPTEIKLIYSYAQGEEKIPIAEVNYEAERSNDFPCGHSDCDKQGQSILYNLDNNDTITLKNISALTNFSEQVMKNAELFLPIIEINQKKCSPWQKIQLQVPEAPNEGNEPDAAHTFYLTAIRPPIIKDYTHYINEISKEIPLLTDEELNYFKKNGNNATIFVHGFHVDPGYFGKDINSFQVDPDDIPWPKISVEYNTLDCTLRRSLDDLRQRFPAIPFGTREINLLTPDDALNGSQAHNWFLNMEYNLNCAASGNFPFDWQTYGLDYTRIISVIWPGNVPKMLYLNAEEPAFKTGLAIIPLLHQLIKAGIEINVIAHSLGSRVILTAMQNIGQENVFENVFLWEAAVPDNVLSSILPYDPDNNIFPQAYLAAKKIVVLYNPEDRVLSEAYRLAMGEQVEGFPKNDLQLIELGMVALQKHQALGSKGPDKFTTDNLSEKISSVNQLNLLEGHGAMRTPSKTLFEEIYKRWIISKKGIKNFGKWKIN